MQAEFLFQASAKLIVQAAVLFPPTAWLSVPAPGLPVTVARLPTARWYCPRRRRGRPCRCRDCLRQRRGCPCRYWNCLSAWYTGPLDVYGWTFGPKPSRILFNGCWSSLRRGHRARKWSGLPHFQQPGFQSSAFVAPWPRSCI